MSTCKGCGAEILWATTLQGRPMPLDPEPVRRVVITDGAGRATQPEHPAGRARIRETWVPHHATCPDAERFRQARSAP